MADFGDMFRAEVVARIGDVDLPCLDDPELADRLVRLCARGREAFPSLVVNDEDFVRFLARCAAGTVDRSLALDDLAVEDLYLACACLAEASGAAEAFDARCSGPIRAALAAVTASATERDEVEQQLRVRLLVGSAEIPPRISTYLGQGPLGRWVGVAAQRLAISLRRSDEVEAGARDRAAMDAAFDWSDPGIALAKRRFRAEFERALTDAMDLIDDRERLLLRMHFVNGMSTTSIAKMFRVSQPSASRWLQAARQSVADKTQQLLRERVKLSPEEVQSLAALMGSQLDLSLSRLLDSR